MDLCELLMTIVLVISFSVGISVILVLPRGLVRLSIIVVVVIVILSVSHLALALLFCDVISKKRKEINPVLFVHFVKIIYFSQNYHLYIQILGYFRKKYCLNYPFSLYLYEEHPHGYSYLIQHLALP